jgi:hypothetical protein
VGYNTPVFVCNDGAQTKIMCETKICKIVDVEHKEFVHANGFIAVANSLKEVKVTIEYLAGPLTGEERSFNVNVSKAHRIWVKRAIHMREHDLLEEYYDDIQSWVSWKIEYPKLGGLKFTKISGEEGANVTASYWKKNSKEKK